MHCITKCLQQDNFQKHQKYQKKVVVSEEKRDILEHPDEFPEFNKEHTALKNRETAVRNPSAHTNVTTLPSH